MKKKLIIVLFIVFSLPSIAQEKDTYQSDSVMRVNKVKTKIQYPENSVTKAKQIYCFDTLGRLTDFILTSNDVDDELQFRLSYFYDGSNQLIRIIDSSFVFDRPNIDITDFMYDSNGNFIAKTYNKKKKKRIISEILFEADSNKETHRILDEDGKITRVNISYYEKPNYTYRFSGYQVPDDSEATINIDGQILTFKSNFENNWDYDFINRYDSSNRIIERTRKVKGIIKNSIKYKYDSSGLLIETSDTTFHNGKESTGKKFFSYIKYE